MLTALGFSQASFPTDSTVGSEYHLTVGALKDNNIRKQKTFRYQHPAVCKISTRRRERDIVVPWNSSNKYSPQRGWAKNQAANSKKLGGIYQYSEGGYILEYIYMCTFELSKKDESGAQSADASKAYRKPTAFNCHWNSSDKCRWTHYELWQRRKQPELKQNCLSTRGMAQNSRFLAWWAPMKITISRCLRRERGQTKQCLVANCHCHKRRLNLCSRKESRRPEKVKTRSFIPMARSCFRF